jgi:predicted MPP superfamily phosphohydrolase
MGFFLTVLTILLGLQALNYYSFVKYLKSTKFYKSAYKWYALIPFVLFNGTFIFIMVVFGRRFVPPEWFVIIGLMPFYVWQAATFFIGLWLLIGKLIKLPFLISTWLLKLIKPVKVWFEKIKARRTVQVVDLSRRRFLRTATFALSSYAFAGATYGIIRHDDFKIDSKQIKITNLPPELKGLTLTLISDIHAGQYMQEHEMREYADIVNDLGSDLIIIPGDFINFQIEDTKSVAKAFRDLKAKYGVYGSLGNHDFFVNPDYVASVMNNESPVQVLRNEHNKITIKGRDLYILGVDDTRDAGIRRNEAILKYIDDTIQNAEASNDSFKSSPKILLCHKPYAFDDMAKRDLDLVLAGHTHGGQVVPFKFGDFNLSFAAFVSKYISGFYNIGNSNMYISRGIGTVGLPIRLNCPPEITKITLV